MTDCSKQFSERGLFSKLEENLAGFSWRTVRREDEKILDDIYRACHAGDFVGLAPEQLQPLLSMQARAQTRHYTVSYPDAMHWILEHETEAVGRLMVDESQEGLHIVDLALVPALQGRRWGRTLVGALLEEASRQNTMVHAHVALGNDGARRFWSRSGFVEIRIEGSYAVLLWDGKTSTNPNSAD